MLLGGLSSFSDMLLLIQQYLPQNSGRQRLKNKHQDHSIFSTNIEGIICMSNEQNCRRYSFLSMYAETFERVI